MQTETPCKTFFPPLVFEKKPNTSRLSTFYHFLPLWLFCSLWLQEESNQLHDNGALQRGEAQPGRQIKHLSHFHRCQLCDLCHSQRAALASHSKKTWDYKDTYNLSDWLTLQVQEYSKAQVLQLRSMHTCHYQSWRHPKDMRKPWELQTL